MSDALQVKALLDPAADGVHLGRHALLVAHDLYGVVTQDGKEAFDSRASGGARASCARESEACGAGDRCACAWDAASIRAARRTRARDLGAAQSQRKRWHACKRSSDESKCERDAETSYRPREELDHPEAS